MSEHTVQGGAEFIDMEGFHLIIIHPLFRVILRGIDDRGNLFWL